MGSSSSKIERNIMVDVLNKSVFNSINRNTLECQNELSAVQDIRIKSTATAEQLKKFQENQNKCREIYANLGYTGEEIKDLCPKAMVEVSDISQDMVMSFKGQCEMDTETLNKIKNDITNQISQSAKEQSTSLGKALENISQVLNPTAWAGSDSNVQENIEQTIKNVVEQNITNENITKAVTQLAASQTLSFEADGGTLQANAIDQKSSYTILMDTITKNVIENVSENIMATESEQERETINKGVFQEIGDAVSTVFDSIFGNWALIIIAVGIILLIGFSIFMRLFSSKSSSSTSNPVASNRMVFRIKRTSSMPTPPPSSTSTSSQTTNSTPYEKSGYSKKTKFLLIFFITIVILFIYGIIVSNV